MTNSPLKLTHKSVRLGKCASAMGQKNIVRLDNWWSTGEMPVQKRRSGCCIWGRYPSFWIPWIVPIVPFWTARMRVRKSPAPTASKKKIWIVMAIAFQSKKMIDLRYRSAFIQNKMSTFCLTNYDTNVKWGYWITGGYIHGPWAKYHRVSVLPNTNLSILT